MPIDATRFGLSPEEWEHAERAIVVLDRAVTELGTTCGTPALALFVATQMAAASAISYLLYTARLHNGEAGVMQAEQALLEGIDILRQYVSECAMGYSSSGYLSGGAGTGSRPS